MTVAHTLVVVRTSVIAHTSIVDHTCLVADYALAFPNRRCRGSRGSPREFLNLAHMSAFADPSYHVDNRVAVCVDRAFLVDSHMDCALWDVFVSKPLIHPFHLVTSGSIHAEDANGSVDKVVA